MLKIANHTHYFKQSARTLIEGVRDFPLDESLQLNIDDTQIQLCCDINAQTTCFAHSFINQKIVQRSHQKNQMLVKACNNKKRDIKTVVDLTAGWGKDSFILASQGQQVCMIEQNLLIFKCIDYLLTIARQDRSNAVFDRLDILHQNSYEYLQGLQDVKPDCLYIDPMFPSHKSGALPAKDLQILQLLTENQNMPEVFELALQKARFRVVVKRPLHGPTLNERKADIVYKEKTIRFDVYLCANR